MTISRRLIASASVLPLAGALLAACSSNSSPSDDSAASAVTTGTSPVRVMKVHRNSGHEVTATPSNAHLKYYGGPVIQNVKIWTVYWNASVHNQDHLNSFFRDITSSAYFDWLREYNTTSPAQTIGHGSFGGSVIDDHPPAGNDINDDQIQKEVQRLIDAGKLPPNDGNNLYMVYFPPGVSITGPGGNGKSCQQFCAYHGTFQKDGKDGFYGVMPDLGGACAGGCGTGSEQDNITEVSSHEMIEAVTDAAVGLAQTEGPPLAWYDTNNGEIGDICVGQAATVAGYVVQKEWSNAKGACIATGDEGGDGGTGDGGNGDGGNGGSCSHSPCDTGDALDSSCDPCVGIVCAIDKGCCQSSWDETCALIGSFLCQQCSSSSGGGTGGGLKPRN